MFLTEFFASLDHDRSQVHKAGSSGDCRHSKYLSRACRFLYNADCCASLRLQNLHSEFVPSFEVADVERAAAEDSKLEHRNQSRSWRGTRPCCKEPSRRRPSASVRAHSPVESRTVGKLSRDRRASTHRNRHLKITVKVGQSFCNIRSDYEQRGSFQLINQCQCSQFFAPPIKIKTTTKLQNEKNLFFNFFFLLLLNVSGRLTNQNV